MSLKVLEKDECEKLGMGAFLGTCSPQARAQTHARPFDALAL